MESYLFGSLYFYYHYYYKLMGGSWQVFVFSQKWKLEPFFEQKIAVLKRTLAAGGQKSKSPDS